MTKEREGTLHLEGQIDATDFGTIRRYLHPPSPIRWLVFVDSDELLVQAADLCLYRGPGDAMLRLRAAQFNALLRSGRVKVAGEIPDGVAATGCSIVDIATIRNDTCCRVIYQPPVYLVLLQ
jgi:hypothetical protein